MSQPGAGFLHSPPSTKAARGVPWCGGGNFQHGGIAILVLSRTEDERILIRCGQGGPLISIEVVEVRGRNVRLGVDAPVDFKIFREEVRDFFEEEAE